MTTRDRILDAAAHVMRTKGLARATTKEIAKAAELSEAALYKHFQDKTGLFLAVLKERVPSDLGALLAELRAGEGDVRENLERVARTALGFYTETFPIAASVFSEPTLLAAHRDVLRHRGTGPHLLVEALAGYLAAEREIGRLPASADPRAAAGLLLGACQYAVFLGFFTDWPTDPRGIVAALWSGLG
ncbi:TetR/AcrR family transcriptional regulator [Actinosynnema sp. NPDC023587]|uniref:TetR/AcrR family transcriptional regulator n=1 Tax=Actinosynnema sp. NPDC023587 TaxID=3154695 RepID=UPI0033E492FA